MYEESIDLSHLPAEGRNIDRQVHLNAWKLKEPDWESRSDLVFDVNITGNHRKALIRGKFKAGITARCHRCLQSFDVDLSRNFRVTYLEPDAERFAREEVELTDSELEVSYMDGTYLPLHEMIREQIYLSLPMKFLCSADCKGLCPNCGANLNEVECDCDRDQMDPRWASLKAIVNELN
ncbi:MAG TPA: DUF177 domain-containing protein [Acidobacteriota bacterium]|nr:DUF177 domain-containing protein [Acidobacteriota bacterium]